MLRGDEFGRLEGATLLRFDRTGGRACPREFDLPRAGSVCPSVLRDERTAFVIAKTDQGNLAKMLVSPGLRKLKPSEKDGPLVPVLIVERFETIDAGDRRSFKARGKELMLFDGFQFDLDAGQVVPEGLGGDIVFLTEARDGPRLAALNDLVSTRWRSRSPPRPGHRQTFGGRAVAARRLRRPLQPDGQRPVVGNARAGRRSRRERSRAIFARTATGRPIPSPARWPPRFPKRSTSRFNSPGARQIYEGFLWTEGKNAIAGSVSMLDHPYSFIAIREGTSLVSE